MRRFILLLLIACSFHVQAQEITFDQGDWQDPHLAQQRRSITYMLNEERVDTMYTEDLGTGEMEMVIQRYPLSRFEYYLNSEEFAPLRRRIDIRQQEIADTVYVEDITTGELVMVIQKFIKDIPNGAYHEFFPNGNIRIKGTLAGYNDDGTLKKTGEWIEWDAQEKVISKETYP